MIKQRLRFLTSLPFIVGVFAIIYVALAVVYFDKDKERQGMTSQVLVMRSALNKPLPNMAELQGKLDDANAESSSLLSSLPNVEQGIDVYGALVDLGNQNGNIDILKIQSSPPIVRKEASGSKTILPYSVTVKGAQEDTLAFISSLTQGSKLLQGLELTSVTVKSDASQDGTKTTELDLYIHTWPDPNLQAQAAGQVSGSKK